MTPTDPGLTRPRALTPARAILCAFALALIVIGGVIVWPRHDPAPDERALVVRLSPVLPGLARDAQTKPSTYICDDDASAPCRAATRTWAVSDASLTLSRLDTYVSRWATDNHLTRPGRTAYRLSCNSAVDETTGLSTPRIICLAPMSTSWERRSVYVLAELTRKTTATGGEVSDPLRQLGSARIVNVSVRAVAYPRKDG